MPECRPLRAIPVPAGMDPEHAIMRQTRHRSVEVFGGYVRGARLLKEDAAAAVGPQRSKYTDQLRGWRKISSQRNPSFALLAASEV